MYLKNCATESDVKLKGDKGLYLIDLRERVRPTFYIYGFDGWRRNYCSDYLVDLISDQTDGILRHVKIKIMNLTWIPIQTVLSKPHTKKFTNKQQPLNDALQYRRVCSEIRNWKFQTFKLLYILFFFFFSITVHALCFKFHLYLNSSKILDDFFDI